MFSISNSSISIESEALAAPVIHTGFHRENPRLTVTNESDIPSSNLGLASKKNTSIRRDSLVVRTSDFSIMNEGLERYFSHWDSSQRIFCWNPRPRSSVVEQMTVNRWVERSNRSAAALLYRDTRTGISAYLRISGGLSCSRFRSHGGSKPPLYTREAA